MLCPVDQAELVMSDRSGVEIDYCPTCRGVWLDRGELDKIIDRSMTQSPARSPGRDYESDRGYSRDRRQDSGHDGYSNDRGRRKESWLGDLFG